MVVKVASFVLRICGTLALLLGLYFWLAPLWGQYPSGQIGLRMTHMTLGILVVLSAIIIAVMFGLGKGGNWGLSVLPVVFGIALAIIGTQQTNWLPSPSVHWIIQVLHLLVAFATIVTGLMLAQRYHTYNSI